MLYTTIPTKTSLYLPQDLIVAMRIVKENEKVNNSNQLEIGLRMYLQRHKKLLEHNGLEI